MNGDRQDAGEADEVPVRGEHRNVPPFRDGADQEVRVRCLNAPGAAGVEVFGGPFEVGGTQRFVGEGAKVRPQAVERPGRARLAAIQERPNGLVRATALGEPIARASPTMVASSARAGIVFA